MTECEQVQNKLNQLCPEFLAGVKIIREELVNLSPSWSCWSPSLCGACAVSAYLVFRYAKKIGLETVFVYCPGHCYTLVEGFVVDLTATQFFAFYPSSSKSLQMLNDDKVLLVKDFKSLCEDFDYYKPEKFLRSSEGIFDATSEWPAGQKPVWFLNRVRYSVLKNLKDKLGLRLDRIKRKRKVQKKCA